MKLNSCKDCQFWIKYDTQYSSDIKGWCRRFPQYQERRYNEWCGEFRTTIDPKWIPSEKPSS